MDLKRLNYFTNIAELGSISEAAERVCISQPSLSRQMRLLEDELGVKLLYRHRRGVNLTAEGAELFARIREPLEQIDRALRDLRSRGDYRQVNLTIGLPPTVAYILAAPLTRRIASGHPGISLRIMEAYAGGLATAIGRGEVDMALLYGPSTEWASMEWGPLVEHLDVDNLLIEDLVLVGPADSDLDPLRPITTDKMSELSLILPSHQNRPSGLRQLIQCLEMIRGRRLPHQLESNSLQLTKEYLESGLGYTLLPYSAISREIEGKRLTWTPIEDYEIQRILVLASNPISVPTESVERVKKEIMEEIAEQVEAGKWLAHLCFDYRKINQGY